MTALSGQTSAISPAQARGAVCFLFLVRRSEVGVCLPVTTAQQASRAGRRPGAVRGWAIGASLPQVAEAPRFLRADRIVYISRSWPYRVAGSASGGTSAARAARGWQRKERSLADCCRLTQSGRQAAKPAKAAPAYCCEKLTR